MNRILSFYRPRCARRCCDLAAGLRAVISQRLLRSNGGRACRGRGAAQHALVAELIEKGDLAGVKEAMEKSLAEGSQTFEPTWRA